MEFLPGPQALESVVRPEIFGAPIEIQGLPAGVLEGLFHGAADARERWKPGLRLTAGLSDGHPSAATTRADEGVSRVGAHSRQDLSDGLVEMESGAPGTIQVRAGDAMGEYLLPQSLGLLLAQQWARAGLLMVHGAAFTIDGCGILALGGKGAGKSVLTAAALAAGARIVSDDWVMVGPTGSGAFCAERIREFLMLRHGQASDRILAQLPWIKPRGIAGRPKTVIRIDDQSPNGGRHFARSIDIQQIWLVKRPAAGRAHVSRTGEASTSKALAGIVQASMPLLFAGCFAVESASLLRTAASLIKQSRIQALEPGIDLIDDPKGVIRRLCRPEKRR